ncbi:MAG: hypothetical protein DMG04_26910 [Acidobacteria bacterium]|nr:MAG: hypothetical protein DMG04_26910 [Acidobacteriota bacterium]PYQ87446.1 MAG: hypothetical protein DMG03_05520 [Acidobacteriota bacterium]PYQ89541.1 MAG: hypothetical protein DMG02_15540 [Acidobacteriota bacterium]PYR05148.1 MAG: hypothetical protein DMF99_29400 [Acidobacteriota bacterium]
MRLVRFFTVGWMGFVVQMAASVALTSVVHVSWLPATGAAAELSIIRNFFWHGLVFMPGITIERTPDSLRTYLRLVRKTIVTMTYDTEHQMTFRRGRPDCSRRAASRRVFAKPTAATADSCGG